MLAMKVLNAARTIPRLPKIDIGVAGPIAGFVLLVPEDDHRALSRRWQVGEAYVLSGPVTTIREAIGVVAAETDKKAPKHALPTGLMKALTPIGPLVGKVMGQPPNLRELISSADGVTFWASHEKATRELGYEPRGLEEGIHAMLDAEGKLPAGSTAA